MMNEDNVVDLLKKAENIGVDVWITGGWGVDALVGHQTRPHNDIDVFVQKKDKTAFTKLLSLNGYIETITENATDDQRVWFDIHKGTVDLHLFEFVDAETLIFENQFYPANIFNEKGTIGRITVRCMPVEAQLQYHQGYERREVDKLDVLLLCNTFRLPVPVGFGEGATNSVFEIDENVVLRQLQLDDYEDIYNTINNQREYLGKWLPFVEYTKDPDDSKAFVEATINLSADKIERVFTIRYKNQFAGLIGFKGTDKQNRKTEIGYWLSEKLQGNGIVTKSVKKLCDFAFSELNMNRIQIKCATQNEKSKTIPKRLGFAFEGIERDGELLTGNVFTDIEIYSKLIKDKDACS